MNHPAVNAAVASVILGAILLIAGRRLFWVFVGAVGFLYGLSLASMILNEGSPLLSFAVALACGVAGALLAVFAQKLAVGLAGGLLGGYFLSEMLYGIEWHHHFAVIPFVFGAILGAILVMLLFDWALIICSSIAGSILIVHSFPRLGTQGNILFLVLSIAGIAIQGGLLHRQRVR